MHIESVEDRVEELERELGKDPEDSENQSKISQNQIKNNKSGSLVIESL